ncbi:hypothetical protein [Methylocystis sp.]|uniref:hypothetical protein n=1 Tax=Methylocystis sp. TaxID=1911079 RepID=UPI0025EC0589|nr:hypothetical protein [Methylocystis sp.]
MGSLRNPPDIEKLEDAGLLQQPTPEADLDGVLGLRKEDAEQLHETADAWDEPSEVE